MSIFVIIQARMSSQRLPGKILSTVKGKPLLIYLVERLSRCKKIDDIIIATSEEETDNPVADFCNAHSIKYYRGSLNNVASRYHNLITQYQISAVVRVCGDSPLMDYRLIDHAMELFNSRPCDLVTNAFPRSFPVGQSVEIIAASIFQEAFQQMSESDDLEHVTRYFYRNKERFVIHNFQADANYSDVRLAVDTEEDLSIFSQIIGSMEKPHWEYPYQELIQIKNNILSQAKNLPKISK